MPLSSTKLIIESTPLDNTKMSIIYLRLLASILNERALKNPAIGALILSLWHPILLNRHNINLYAQLKTHAKPPNFAESFSILIRLFLKLMYFFYNGLTIVS